MPSGSEGSGPHGRGRVRGLEETQQNTHVPSAYLLVSTEPRHCFTARDVKFSLAIISRPQHCLSYSNCETNAWVAVCKVDTNQREQNPTGDQYTPPPSQARQPSQKSGQNGGSTPTLCLDKAAHARDMRDSKRVGEPSDGDGEGLRMGKSTLSKAAFCSIYFPFRMYFKWM